jgi:hypothetical protein
MFHPLYVWKAAQEAVETMYEGEINIPAASDIGK